MKKVDLATDRGQVDALNKAYAEFESDKDRVKAMTRATLIGRGLAIRSLRLRESQFRDRSRNGKSSDPKRKR